MKPKPTIEHRVVMASAGSGKTYQLTEHYLGLLRAGAEPASVLATTFTRKAAGEILGRVLARLAESAQKDAQDQMILAQLCRGLHHVAISTMDSFFNRVAMGFRHELGIARDATVVAETDVLAEQLRGEAIDAMLADSDMEVLVDLMMRLHHDSATRSVTRALDDVVRGLHAVYREAPDRALWDQLEVPGCEMSATELTDAIGRLTDMGDQLPRNADGKTPNKTWVKAWQKSQELLHGRDWEKFVGTGIAVKIAMGEASFGRKPIEEVWIDAYMPLIEHARFALVNRVAEQTRATFDLLSRFDGHDQRLRRERGVMLYSDIPHKLANELPMMGLDDDEMDGGIGGGGWGVGLWEQVYYRLDGQVSHLLLDEFQDTSSLQWRILRPMADEMLSHADEMRTFFCVGDVKQAIYGWRGGVAEIFDQVKEDLHALPESAWQRMNESYRSSQVVLDTVDAVFEKLRDGQTLDGDKDEPRRAGAMAWLEKYDRHEAHFSALPGYVALLVSPRADDESGGDDGKDGNARSDRSDWGHDQGDDDEIVRVDDAHDVAVAEHVRALTATMPGRSIGVLVRRNATASRLIARLRAMGVDASGEGGGQLTDDAAVLAVLAAMTLADHPGDTVAAYHVRQSPLGAIVGFSRETWQGKQTIYAVARAIRMRLASEGYAAVLMDWVQQLVPYCDGRNVARLTQLVGMADRIDPLRLDRPSRFVDFVRGADVTEPSPGAVRVMTIHKSKGLEFDAVVLPELDGALNRGRLGVQVNVERDGVTGPITAVYRTTNSETRALSEMLQSAYEREQSRQFKEDLCSLYVAMTRARFGLYLWVKPTDKKSLSMARLIRDGLVDGDADGDGDANGVLYSEGDADWFLQIGDECDGDDRKDEDGGEGKRAVNAGDFVAVAEGMNSAGENVGRAGGRSGGRSLRAVSPSSLEAGATVSVSSLMQLETSGGMAYGTAIHAALAEVAWYDEAKDQWEGNGELPDGVDAACLREVMTRPSLDVGEDCTLWRERPFLVRDGQDVLSGVFDRVVLIHDAAARGGAEAPGGAGVVRRAVIIDFKTDAVTDANVDAVVKRYQPQMQAYVRALSRMVGVDAGQIETQFVFVGSGVVVRPDLE